MKEILIFSDFTCPFCYIGFSIIDKLYKEKSFKFKFLPVVLNAEFDSGPVDLRDFIDEKELNEAYKRIDSLGNEYGLVYKNRYYGYNTYKLQLVSLLAAEKDKFLDFARLAFYYIFTLEKDPSQLSTILEISEKTKLNKEDVLDALNSDSYKQKLSQSKDLMKKYNVESVPSFIVDGKLKPSHLEDYNSFIIKLFRD